MAEVNHFTPSKSKKRLDLDWEFILPTDDSGDDRPPDILIATHAKSKGRGGDLQQPEMEEEDIEYQMKTDGELEGMIRRIKSSISSMSNKLPDKGEKYKASLRRCTAEVERRKRSRITKGDTRCKETLQLSDQSDDGESCRKKKSDQKSSASPNFATLFSQKLDGNENHSRTVNAFEDDFSYFNSFQGKKMKQNGQFSDKGGSKQQLSSRSKQFRCPTTLMGDSKKQRITDAQKEFTRFATSSPYHSFRKGPKPDSSSKAHAPQNLSPKKLRPKNGSSYCLVDEEPLTENLDDWAHAPHNSPPIKSRPRRLSTYRLVDDDLIAEKLDDCMQDVTVYYPSRDDQNSVEVFYRDMACLAPQAYLSSSIMNFYIRYLEQTSSSENMIGNYHFFNTYFYNKLQKLSYKEDSFVKFRKWWKGVNIFEKAYILLPVHEKAHWSLGIICIPRKEDELGPIVLHLDSLGLHDSKSILDNIKRFVKEEWKYLRSSQEDSSSLPIATEIWENLDLRMEDRRVSVPQQRNEYDCGVFVLYYMERFIKEAPHRFKEEDLSMFSKQWFRPQEASDLRTRTHNLLVQHFKIAKPKETISSPNSC